MEKHRNILYGIVFVLLVLQFVSFITLSSQVSKVSSQLESKTKSLESAIDSYNALYKESFQEITSLISEQEASFNQEITQLKSTTGDFSAVIEEAVKGVVSVGTDKGAGSGFIISSDGYIVTNEHVISGGSNIKVLLYDGRIVNAYLIGGDPFRDIALLKIAGSGYDNLDFADSNDVQVGQKVIAIGNPLGLSFSVAEGIVSAIHRIGPNERAEYIQTDVSLNPGNSGGPLIDKQGKVVGINNFKIGDSEGLGFALESDYIQDTTGAIFDAIAAAQQ